MRPLSHGKPLALRQLLLAAALPWTQVQWVGSWKVAAGLMLWPGTGHPGRLQTPLGITGQAGKQQLSSSSADWLPPCF